MEESREEGAERAGLFSALKSLGTTLLASGKTRLELLSNEIETEKLRALQLVLVSQAMAFCFALGIILAVIFLVVLFWEQRTMVLGIFTLVFFALGGFFLTRLKQATQRSDKVFSASIEQLQEDIRQLKSLTGHEPPA